MNSNELSLCVYFRESERERPGKGGRGAVSENGAFLEAMKQ